MATGDKTSKEGPRRDELLDNLRATLRVFFPPGTAAAEEERVEGHSMTGAKALDPHDVLDFAAADGRIVGV